MNRKQRTKRKKLKNPWQWSMRYTKEKWKLRNCKKKKIRGKRKNGKTHSASSIQCSLSETNNHLGKYSSV